ncbi:putative transporter [Exidia glandulosa HHB12029]|uniref:Putative transporter n=1 Tax=Exidia glandulosa HHB12029 TaxID=1314781 RepID=A0A165IIG6_EXIGL|nr:putative transporter [Exidia glandulosa HHB12029]
MSQFEDHFEHLEPAKHGLIVSSILLAASVFSLVGGPLADRISRTRTIALGSLVFVAGEAMCLGSQRGQLGVFIAGRCIAGAGEGLFLSTITTYTLEIAPTHIRGRLSVTVQLFVTVGIAAGYFTCFGSQRLDSDWAWRIPYVVQIISGSILACGALLLPHSPRWLKHVGRAREAQVAWGRLGVSLAEAEKEEEAAERDEQLQATTRDKGLKETWAALWRKDVRTRTILGVFLMGLSNASGVDGVLYYAPLLFSQAGLSSTTASFLASGVTGLVNIAVTIPTLMYSDKWGRRPSTIRGGVGIAASMLLIGTLYASRATDAKAGKIAVIALIFVFLVSFAMSWAVVIRVYASEIQPMRTRAAATALSQAANWIVNWLVAFSTPLFLAKSSSGPYFLFGGCSLAVVVVCFFFQPESRGISLEDLDRAFEGRPWDLSLKGLVPCLRPDQEDIELRDVHATARPDRLPQAPSPVE